MRKIKLLIQLLFRKRKAIFAFEVYRYNILKKIVKILLPGELWRFTEYGNGEWRTKGALELLVTTPGRCLDDASIDRKFTMFQLMKLVKEVSGDSAECGAYRGDSSYIIARYLRREHHIFDSCDGLSNPGGSDEKMYWKKGDLSCGEHRLRDSLRDLPNIRYFIGWIPYRFKAVEDHFYSFVHIDVDLYLPTKESLDFFYPRVNKGGIILLDDYGFRQCSGVRRAVDFFFQDKPEKIVELTTGQAFIIKGISND